MGKIKIKAKEKEEGIVSVIALLKHPMLTYDQAKKKGKEPNFIVYIEAKSNGDVVYEASTSQFLSKNPLIKFKYKGKKGEELELSWVDLKGNTESKKVKVKG
ncbi:MAG: thiosulfate oxidation carrier complex protein SoxZ [Epsilonproteobacteria bacterium]|nr:thiosulfate oxidation carrier complex protein SoxZ [Campylobacterota bacterium]